MFQGNTITFDKGVKLKTLSILRNMVLVVEDEAKTETDSGIIIPDSAVEQHPQRTGTVVHVGCGYTDDSGMHHAPDFSEGERVIYYQMGGDTWVIEETAYTALRSEEILAKINS
jgi:chaperonin GroES